MALAWIITSAFYVLASLGSQNKIPARFGWFLAGMVAISLLMHFVIQRLRHNSSQVLLPIATLLNGIGYVEIARWHPSYAHSQAMWFLVSAVALTLTLIFVRHVRDLDRYRYLTLRRRDLPPGLSPHPPRRDDRQRRTTMDRFPRLLLRTRRVREDPVDLLLRLVSRREP